MEIVFHHNIFEQRVLRYVIILAEYHGKYIFVKHHKRQTWELPGGHIEVGEPPTVAARRELMEETGAIKFSIRPLCDYGVIDDAGSKTYGRLYYANVKALEGLHFETDDRLFSEKMPEALTYPDIQPIVFDKMVSFLEAGLNLEVLPDVLAVTRLAPDDAIPEWAKGDFLQIVKTSEELSIVCSAKNVPEGIISEADWRVIKVLGPLDFSAVGILSGISSVLAEACISIFAISTFDTDYILVKSDQLEKSKAKLLAAGYGLKG